MKRKLQAIGVLLLLGAIKLPLEDRVTRDLRAQRLLHEPVSASALESLGQSGLAAVLGRGRGLVAGILQP